MQILHTFELFFYFIHSTDEVASDHILKGLRVFASVCGQLERTNNRDSFITCICKTALPPNYYASNLIGVISTASVKEPTKQLSKTLSSDSTSSSADKKEEINGHSIVVRVFVLFFSFSLHVFYK